MLTPQPLFLLPTAKPEFDSDDIAKPLVKRGFLEASAKISECDTREGGAGLGVLSHRIRISLSSSCLGECRKGVPMCD